MYSKRLSQVEGIANNSILAINNSGTAVSSSAITVDSSNRLTYPSQPLFVAYLNTNKTNATGAGSNYQVGFDSTLKNVGSCFTTGVFAHFTAPIAATYLFCGSIYYSNLSAAMTEAVLDFNFTSPTATLQAYDVNCNNVKGASGIMGIPFSVIYPMAASQQLALTVPIFNGAGDTATINGLNGGSVYLTYWSGYIIGS